MILRADPDPFEQRRSGSENCRDASDWSVTGFRGRGTASRQSRRPRDVIALIRLASRRRQQSKTDSLPIFVAP